MAKRGERSAPRVDVTCPCGKKFTVLKSRYDAGHGRRCSKACQNKYAVRPAGLKYRITKENPTTFRPGSVPWNKGTRGLQQAWNKGTGKQEEPPSHRWRGMVGYVGAHYRVRRARGRAAAYDCSHADGTCKGPVQWANISGNYEDIKDFMPLCASHHQRYDRARGAWG